MPKPGDGVSRSPPLPEAMPLEVGEHRILPSGSGSAAVNSRGRFGADYDLGERRQAGAEKSSDRIRRYCLDPNRRNLRMSPRTRKNPRRSTSDPNDAARATTRSISTTSTSPNEPRQPSRFESANGRRLPSALTHVIGLLSSGLPPPRSIAPARIQRGHDRATSGGGALCSSWPHRTRPRAYARASTSDSEAVLEDARPEG
jgi:hypothetical protein